MLSLSKHETKQERPRLSLKLSKKIGQPRVALTVLCHGFYKAHKMRHLEVSQHRNNTYVLEGFLDSGQAFFCLKCLIFFVVQFGKVTCYRAFFFGEWEVG